MTRWPWRRHRANDDELREARKRLARDRERLERLSHASSRTVTRLAAVASAEQDEIRKNHLAATIHDALALTHGRHPR